MKGLVERWVGISRRKGILAQFLQRYFLPMFCGCHHGAGLGFVVCADESKIGIYLVEYELFNCCK